MLNSVLFENHLEFLRTHRGKVTKTGDHFCIQSEKAPFTYFVPGSDDILPLLDRFSTAHLAPWVSAENRQEISKAGWVRKGSLSYMKLRAFVPASKPSPTVRSRTAKSIADIESFSEIQGRAFCETEESYREWQPWMRQANLRNADNPNQRFYIAALDDKDASVALSVRVGKTVGIYAVATLPVMRKHGISTVLMEKMISELKTDGAEILTLQVVKGSYAESLYLKQGFEEAFEVEIWGRNS